MAPEIIEHAFEPFFTTKEPGKGTGLGLSGVYSFARQSGGFAVITSALGKGATIDIYLPRSRDDQPARAPLGDAVALGDGELVLVVEDEGPVREVTMKRLESLGYAVLGAASGREAVKILMSDEPVDLVLSDIHMPGGMSGDDLAAWIAANRPQMKVVLASGNVHDRSAGARTLPVLAKPYTGGELARAIRVALYPAGIGQTSPANT